MGVRINREGKLNAERSRSFDRWQGMRQLFSWRQTKLRQGGGASMRVLRPTERKGRSAKMADQRMRQVSRHWADNETAEIDVKFSCTLAMILLRRAVSAEPRSWQRRSETQMSDNSIVGRVFGAWRVASIDATGRRVLVVCVCGATRTLARGALVSSDARRGCRCVRVLPASQNGRKKPISDDVRAAFSDAARWHRGGPGTKRFVLVSHTSALEDFGRCVEE